MPTFLPMIPVTISFSVLRSTFFVQSANANAARRTTTRRTLLVLFPERLNLDVNAGRQIELHQRVDGLLRRLEDVDEPLVGADLELLPRFLVHVRRAKHGPLVL